MKLSKAELELLQTFADDEGYDLRTDYSGRGMFGTTCIGFILDRDQSEFSLGLKLAVFLSVESDNGNENIDYESLLESLQYRPAGDSMGMGSILYFPNIQPPEKGEDVQEDD